MQGSNSSPLETLNWVKAPFKASKSLEHCFLFIFHWETMDLEKKCPRGKDESESLIPHMTLCECITNMGLLMEDHMKSVVGGAPPWRAREGQLHSSCDGEKKKGVWGKHLITKTAHSQERKRKSKVMEREIVGGGSVLKTKVFLLKGEKMKECVLDRFNWPQICFSVRHIFFYCVHWSFSYAG